MSELFFDEVVADSQLAETYTIIRSTAGSFAPGGYKDQKQQIPNYGVVTAAGPKDLAMVPEGDEVHEARAFYSNVPLYDTDASSVSIADILQWNGDNYRVVKVFVYANRNYWKAIAVRMAGS